MNGASAARALCSTGRGGGGCGAGDALASEDDNSVMTAMRWRVDMRTRRARTPTVNAGAFSYRFTLSVTQPISSPPTAVIASPMTINRVWV
jgi:hypothetical protein